MSEYVEATGWQRIRNNAMRHSYRLLTEDEKALVVRLKDVGGEFIALLHQAGGMDPEGERFDSRELSIAHTKIEEAVMWAVRHVTR